jgi:hypothetical protein
MKSLPFPLRVAAGLAVTTAERVRELPRQLTGLPVTVASQVLQASMRLQQHVTELAIKGDDALANLRPVEDSPSWATFDEDAAPDFARPGERPSDTTVVAGVDEDVSGRPFETNGHSRATVAGDLADNKIQEADIPAADIPRTELPDAAVIDPLDPADGEDPWAAEERALAEDHADGEFDSMRDVTDAPAGLTNYDELTLPQLRARLRSFSLSQLEELLAYERANANRASFVGMLGRRIANVRGNGGQDGTETDR